MNRTRVDNRSFRGVLQSDDGVIVRVLEKTSEYITFETNFGLSEHMIQRLKSHPEHLVFSERSRIARLGVQISSRPVTTEKLEGSRLVVVQQATSVIPGYPGLEILGDFFDVGLPVGRLVFCDPNALLSSEQVLVAIEKAELKLPASTSISSDGSIVIAPHKVVCRLRNPIDKATFGRILFHENGRQMLNRFQERLPVPALVIPPNQGVITTCSMYLNEHYVVLQSGFALGRNLPATVLDPIKTRGVRIYLEIVNGSSHPIVNPLIAARIYGAPRSRRPERRRSKPSAYGRYSFGQMRTLGRSLAVHGSKTCPFIDKPAAIIEPGPDDLEKARIMVNGPQQPCKLVPSRCTVERRNFSPESKCPHVYATSLINPESIKEPVILAMRYFPNLIEHREIINLASLGKIESLYFYEASCEHGPFLSQEDHSRLLEYHAFGLRVFWICGLNNRIMVHTIRDGKGYFVAPERLPAFHKSMFFAFYGSTLALSESGQQRLGELMDALVSFWGRNIGIVTGGGSGVMEVANTLARERGILSGANFLDITDQPMTTDVDFCQVFQDTCRHSRQKWFEIASFPIFNVGGLGSLEELGITLCNMKLSIMEQVPIVLFDTEGERRFWKPMQEQIDTMVRFGRAPAWIRKYLLITDDPQEVIRVYREKLQLF